MKKKRKRRLKARNPIARVVRRLKAKVVPSAKVYRRRPKHKRKVRPDNGNGA